MKKPNHSIVGRFWPNKGIARIATKSGSEQDSNAVLAAPIIRDTLKKDNPTYNIKKTISQDRKMAQQPS